MSLSFYIFPTNKYVPSYEELKRLSLQKLNRYLQKENISCDISIECSECFFGSDATMVVDTLTMDEQKYAIFDMNQNGYALVFYHKAFASDEELWEYEMSIKPRAEKLKDKIAKNMELGYSWEVKRTAGQPAIVCLYYGYLAIAIAELTEGIIYSDDGAWDYARLPIDYVEFEKEYLDIDRIEDDVVKENVMIWLEALRIEG